MLVLLAYPVTAFVVGADWSRVAHDTLVPSMPLGTTISPYLSFWQASEEVEEEKEAGQNTLAERRGAKPQELELRNIDVSVGAFFSTMVMFFIILTTAITLHGHGITRIESTRCGRSASAAGRQVRCNSVYRGRRISCYPYAGGLHGLRVCGDARLASGIGQEIEAGACILRAHSSLYRSGVGVGVALDFAGVNPVKALYWTAVINGLVAPFLLLAILLPVCEESGNCPLQSHRRHTRCRARCHACHAPESFVSSLDL